MRWLVLLLLGIHLLPGAPAEPREVVRAAVRNYFADVETARLYTGLRRRDSREFDSSGKLAERQLETRRIDYVDGVRVSWTVAIGDQALPPADLAKAEQQARAAAAEWKAKPKSERERLTADGRKQSDRETGYLRDLPDALEFRPAPPEQLAGRPCLVFDFFPRPGYKPPNMQARVFEKVRGRIWIDREDLHMARLDGEVYDTVSVGGLLAKVEKGTRFQLEQQRFEPGEWFPRRTQIRFDVRVLMVKQIHRQIETTFSEVQRYRGAVWAD